MRDLSSTGAFKDCLTSLLFISWLQEGKQEADSNRFNMLGKQPFHNPLQLLKGKRRLDLAGRSDALRHLEAPSFRHEQFRFLRNKRVELWSMLTADGQHIAKSRPW